MFIVNLANYIGRAHGKFFLWLSHKSEQNPWFAFFLTIMALYEVCEHLLGPTLAVLFATGHLNIK
jgi:hypothetical protein